MFTRRNYGERDGTIYIGKRAVSHTKIHSAQFGKAKNESMEHGTTVRMARTKINKRITCEDQRRKSTMVKIENGKVLRF